MSISPVDLPDDPYLDYLESIDPVVLDRELQEEYEAVRAGVGIVPVAIGLAAAYIVYRKYMEKRIKEAIQAYKADKIDAGLLETAAGVAFDTFVPKWLSLVAPYVLQGYLEGMRLTESGYVPVRYLETIAYKYALDLGEHMNEVSKTALVLGYQGQVNRKVPIIIAAERSATAYGVPPRGMNALVNVWSTEDAKVLSNKEIADIKSMKATSIIEAQNELRGRLFGENEHWASRSQAKQLVWMYGVEAGIVPSTATRTWVTAADERVCPTCGPMNETSVPVGVKFSTDAGELWTPPAHVNCRCDVFLDFNFTEVVQEKIDQLLEEESVTKAYGQDPYDRDKSGRFASTESRVVRPKTTYKAPSPSISIADQVNIALNLDFDAIDAARAEAEKMFEEGSSIDLSTSLGLKTSLGLGGLDLSGKLNLPEQSLLSPSLDTGLKSNLDTSLTYSLEINLDKQIEKLVHRMPERLRFPVGRTWIPRDRPLGTLLDPTDMHLGDVLSFDDTQVFYEIRPTESMGRNQRTINSALSDYWYTVINNKIMMDFKKTAHKNNDEFLHVIGTKTFYDVESDNFVAIDADAYYMALINSINGIGRSESEEVDVRLANSVDDYVTINVFDIAENLGVLEKIEQYAPTILIVNHVSSETKPANRYISNDDTWINPGTFMLGSSYDEPGLYHLPYYAFYGEPRED